MTTTQYLITLKKRTSESKTYRTRKANKPSFLFEQYLFIDATQKRQENATKYFIASKTRLY